jgi:starch-binding outer membrane protein, SusD/RagB family
MPSFWMQSLTPAPRRVLRTTAFALVASAVVSGCTLFDTDVTNPNAVTEVATEDPAAAPSLVNGQRGAFTNALNGVIGIVGAASDELTWAGSREYWNLLDGGDIGDPVNEYSNGTFPYLAQSRWQSDFTVKRLEQWDNATPRTLRNRSDLAKAYIFAGLTYLTIGENYEDFIISSDRQTNGANIGPDNMRITFDSATAYLTKGLTLATTLADNELRSQALGLRARARWSRAVWTSLRSPRGFPAQPLINDAGANADAAAALAIMAPTYRFRVASTAQNGGGYFNVGFEINQRLEIRAGDVYINPNAARTRPLDGIAGIKLNDPVSGTPDATLAAAINDCCRSTSTQFIPHTVISAREMNLILAEAALATNNTAEFTTRINAVRALDSKPAWSATPSARDMLIHERRVGLFMQGRRLNDHFRFNQAADRWLPIRAATRRPCFFPVSFDERLQNPLAPQPAQDKPVPCQ